MLPHTVPRTESAFSQSELVSPKASLLADGCLLFPEFSHGLSSVLSVSYPLFLSEHQSDWITAHSEDSLQLDYQPSGASVDLGQRGLHHAQTMPTHVLGHAVHVHRCYLVTRSLDSLAPPPPSPHHHPCLKPGVCGSLRDLLSFPDPHSPVLSPHMLRNLPSAPFSPQVPHSPWKLGRFRLTLAPISAWLRREVLLFHISPVLSLLCGQPGPAVGIASLLARASLKTHHHKGLFSSVQSPSFLETGWL